MRVFGLLGAALAGGAVAFGAFGAHALAGVFVERGPAWWQTATQYLGFHGLALLALASLSERGAIWRGLPWLWLAGSVLFAGSLMAMAVGAPRWFGAITPLGGACYLIGWVIVLIAFAKVR